MFEISDKTPQRALKESNNKNIEVVREKYLQPILEVLDRKNIKGSRLLKQGNRVMLLIDKCQLNSINANIINAMNMVYPNHVVCIEDVENPFDYKGLYEEEDKDVPSKRNKKVRPYTIFEEHWTAKDDVKAVDYFKRYQFSGIELDTRKLEPVMQLGFFLEFVNTLQMQNPLEHEDIQIKKGVEVYSSEILRRYDEYIKQGCPDKQKINLWVEYNEAIQDDKSEGLELKEDPYFNRLYIMELNKENEFERFVKMNLSPKRMKINVDNYIAAKRKESNSAQRDNVPKPSKILESPNRAEIQIPEL